MIPLPVIIGIGAALLLLVLFLLTRVGADMEYGSELILRIKAGPFHFTILPGKKKPAKKKKTPAPALPKEKADLKNIFVKARELLPLALDTARGFRNKLRIDLLVLEITAAGEDPAEAGILYGGVSAFLGILMPAVENCFDLRRRRIIARLDFQEKKPSLYLHTVFSIAIWQGMVLGAGFLFRYLKWRRTQKKQKAAAGISRSALQAAP